MDLFHKDFGVAHSDELFLMFQTLLPFETAYTPEDRIVADHLVALWTNFASTGDPSILGQPKWER